MRKKLGEILIASGVVTQADLDLALSDQTAGEPSRVGDLLVALGRITPVQLARALSQQHAIPFIQLPPVPRDVLLSVPLDFQQQHRVVPFRVTADSVSLAMADPSDSDAVEALRSQLNKKITRYVAAGDEIDALHVGLSGAAAVDLPSVAPVIAPSRGTPAPTAQDLFGSLELDAPAPASALGDELFSGLDLPPPTVADVPPPPTVAPMTPAKAPRHDEEEPEFFEAAPFVAPPRAAGRSPVPAAAPPPPAPSAPEFELVEEISIEAASEGSTSSPSGTFAPFEPGPPPAVADSGTFELPDGAEVVEVPAAESSGLFGPTSDLFAPPPAPAVESSGSFEVSLSEGSGDFAAPAPPVESSGSFEVSLAEGSGDFSAPPAASVPESSGSFAVAFSEDSGSFSEAAPAASGSTVDDFFSQPLPPAPMPVSTGSGAFSATEESVAFEEVVEEPAEPPAEPLFGPEESLGEALFSDAPGAPPPPVESAVGEALFSDAKVPPVPVDESPPGNDLFPEDSPGAGPETFSEPPPVEVPAPEAPPESLPSWLGGAPPGVAAPAPGFVLTPGEWTGALDDVAPSRLIVAAVKALVVKGLLTEAEILEALGKKT